VWTTWTVDPPEHNSAATQPYKPSPCSLSVGSLPLPILFAPSLEPSLGCFWDWLSGDEAVCSPRRKCHCSFLSAPNLSQPPRPRPHLRPRPGPLNLHFDLHSFFSSIASGPIDSKAQRPPLLVGCFIICIACFVACLSSVVCGGWEAPSMPWPGPILPVRNR
jgi:hypothetical protein